jgi:hypothetical protein
MATEKLKFKLELYATMWDRPPHAEILINDKSHFTGDITGTEDKPNIIEFEHELAEGSEHFLTIKRSNKTTNQTTLNEKGGILKDQVLHIKHMEIDDIDTGALVYEGLYIPHYPEPWATQQKEAGIELPETFKNVVAMGHNGEWRFTFASPFYMWLLENLY